MADRHTVLVVDDEPDVRLLCRVTLEFAGYRVIEAEDGQVALARLAEEVPDVIVLAVMLAELDGWQVLETVQADPRTRDVPVVMLCATVDDSDQVRGWSFGAAEYVTKPLSPTVLSRILSDVLATEPGEQERRRQLMVGEFRSLLDPG